jgi:hypothetical protein
MNGLRLFGLAQATLPQPRVKTATLSSIKELKVELSVATMALWKLMPVPTPQ